MKINVIGTYYVTIQVNMAGQSQAAVDSFLHHQTNKAIRHFSKHVAAKSGNVKVLDVHTFPHLPLKEEHGREARRVYESRQES